MTYRRLRILLVEDDELSYVLTLALLAGVDRRAFELDWAPTFEIAAAAIARQDHDIYLIGYRLDARHGLHLLQQAIGRGGPAPVILMTGHGPSRADIEAIKAGITEYQMQEPALPVPSGRTLPFSPWPQYVTPAA
jgi:DNA-binding NtrC family response regulator